MMRCSKCGREIDALEPEIWEEQIGWAKKRGAGGLNQLKLRTQTGAVMCATCMVQALHGMPQATLFDELGA